jgi:hypothetical protein
MACVSRYLKSGDAGLIFDGIKEGIAYQASFGYKALDWVHQTLPDGRKVRRIKELQLFEVSTCPPGHAMNEATRSWPGKSLDDVLEELIELKAGWRHGTHDDVAKIREIMAICASFGVTLDPEPAPLLAARTSVDDLLSEVESLYAEV